MILLMTKRKVSNQKVTAILVKWGILKLKLFSSSIETLKLWKTGKTLENSCKTAVENANIEKVFNILLSNQWFLKWVSFDLKLFEEKFNGSEIFQNINRSVTQPFYGSPFKNVWRQRYFNSMLIALPNITDVW